MADRTVSIEILAVDNATSVLIEVGEAAQDTGQKVKQAGDDSSAAGLISTSGWVALGGTLLAAAGYAAGLGVAFGAAAVVGLLALGGLSGGLGGLTSAAQSFRFELLSLEIGPIQRLQAAAQEGLLPHLTDGLKDVAPLLDEINPTIKDLADIIGTGLQAGIGIIAQLTAGFLDFGRASLLGLSGLGDVLREFAGQLNDVFEELTQSGTASAAMAGLVQILGALLQLLPPLVDAAVHLAAAMGPGLAQAVGDVVNLLTPFLNVVSQYPDAFAKMIEGLAGIYAGYQLWEAGTKAVAAAELVMDALDPFTAPLIALAALVALLYVVSQNWDQVVDGFDEGAHAIGGFFEEVGREIVDFFNGIVDAIMAPFKAIGSAFSSLQGLTGAIPHFAEGGIVTRPTIGLFGEAGPEAIIPLSHPSAQGAFGGGGGGGGDTHNYYISGVIGPPSSVVTALRSAQRQTSRRGFGYGFGTT